jgi:kumamolisin
MRITVELQPRRADELQRFVDDLQRPSSPVFHRFLSFDQWKSRYAPSNADVRRVVAWASSRGLTTTHRFADNLAIVLDGPVAAVERTFRLHLNSYFYHGHQFYANDRDPTIDAAVSTTVKDVLGLNTFEQVYPASGVHAPVDIPQPRLPGGPFLTENSSHGDAPRTSAATLRPSYCCGQNGLIEPADLWSSQGYDLGALQGLGHCCNPSHSPTGTPKEESLAIIGDGAPSQNDINTFFQTYGLASNLTYYRFDSASCCDQNSQEMTLDTEWSGAMSNSRGSYLDTAHIYVYSAETTGLDPIEDNLEAWQQALSDDHARVASTSFGTYEDAYGGLFTTSISDYTDVTNAMAATGWTIVAAAGDHGAYDDCNKLSVEYPASDPNVIAVGGTALTLSGTGANVKYSNEVAWTGNGCGTTNYPGSNNGGGGGGCSNTFVVPAWQDFQVTGCVDSGGTARRALPDVALNAARASQAVYSGGTWTGVGGTSIAAPEVAGFFAQVNAYLGYIASTGDQCGAQHNVSCVPLGNPAAAMWTNGLTTTPLPRNPFYDITSGCNAGNVGQGYCAKGGYDLATGFGSFNMLQMAWVLMHWVFAGGYQIAPYPSVTFGGPPTHAWYNTDQTVTFNISGLPGIAGYDAQWDTPPASSDSEATPGSGDAFWDGPQNINSTVGSLSLAAAGQGCHTAFTTFWTNLGVENIGVYGSLCFDTIPPTIKCANPDGQWHASDVTIACTASDSGSGLANSSDSNFTLSTSVPTGTETNNAQTDTHQVCDVAGNCATAGPIGGNMVDKKPPVITIPAPTATNYAHSATLTLNYAATDGGSGVQSITATMDGSPTIAGQPITNGQSINLLTTLPLGQHTFTVTSTDNVGNQSSQSVTFTIVVTAQSIKSDVTQFYNSRAITNQGIETSLLATLNAAASARSAGDCTTAANDYRAFIHQVNADTPAYITPNAANIMIADAQYLIAHCP